MRKTPTDHSKEHQRRALEIASYRPRVRQAGETMPPAQDLLKRGQYRPGIDNDMSRRVTL